MSQRRFIKFSTIFTSRQFWFFLAVFLLSFHQATILAYGDFGQEAIGAAISRPEYVNVSYAEVQNYVKQLGLGKITAKLAGYGIPLFLVQVVPALIYACFGSVRYRRIVALMIWLFPGLLGLMYLMSPVFVPSTLPGFMFLLDPTSEVDVEDFTEGLTFTLAVMGWFNIFWLIVTIKAWFFSRD